MDLCCCDDGCAGGLDGALERAGDKPPPVWGTRLGQCDEKAPHADWLYAICCPLCAAAEAKSKADDSDELFNLLCFTPVASAQFVRYSYGIQGVCGDDMCVGTLCLPCVARRAFTESSTRGKLTGLYGKAASEWKTPLFGCTAMELGEAICCPCAVAFSTHKMVQPNAESCWFDMCCTLPTAWYGQVRHTFGIEAETGLVEDLLVPLFCCPCALIRARSEASYRWSQGQAVHVQKPVLMSQLRDAQRLVGKPQGVPAPGSSSNSAPLLVTPQHTDPNAPPVPKQQTEQAASNPVLNVFGRLSGSNNNRTPPAAGGTTAAGATK